MKAFRFFLALTAFVAVWVAFATVVEYVIKPPVGITMFFGYFAATIAGRVGDFFRTYGLPTDPTT
jgi:hypothetical protein